jgi:hypothetical protein
VIRPTSAGWLLFRSLTMRRNRACGANIVWITQC